LIVACRFAFQAAGRVTCQARGTHARSASFACSNAATAVLVDVHHWMSVMTEETFGPVVAVMPVKNDDEAVALMNDSRYGLTASIWTSDVEAAIQIADRVETGTWFLNRCDYLDPALAWRGVTWMLAVQARLRRPDETKILFICACNREWSRFRPARPRSVIDLLVS
jgi:hypothetical protein